jgi:hypothetical protein
MIRKLKTLPIALVAMLALGAFAAQTASAETNAYHAPELPAGATVFFTVEQHTNTGHQVFSTGGGSVTCTTLHGVGTATNPASSQTFEPKYSGCTAFGFATAHVTNNKCHYTFGTPTAVDLGHVKHTVNAPVVGPAGCTIVITPTTFGVSACTQTVQAQTPTGGHVITTNVGAGNLRHVTVETTVSGIHYTGTGGACGASGVTHTDGKYEGNSLTTCFSDANRTVRTACTVK